MEHQATLRFSEPLIRQAVLGFWRRSVGVGFIFALALLTIGLASMLYAGDRSWLVGVFASGLVLGISFPIALFVVHYRNSTQKLRSMGSPQASLIATESTLSLSSGAGSSSLPWSSVLEIWQFPTFWLLLFSKAQFITLPLADISPSLQAFIIQRVRTAGGKTG